MSDGHSRRFPPFLHLATRNLQKLFKHSFEVPVAQWVYKWVESGIDVSKPYGKHVKLMVHTLSAERHDHESDEVGYPTQKEGRDDEAQLLGRLVLFVDLEALDAVAGMANKLLPSLPQRLCISWLKRISFLLLSPGHSVNFGKRTTLLLHV